MDPSRTTIGLPSATVSYLQWGPDSGPTVLLLHGAGLDSASLSWGPLGEHLGRAGHRVLAPDHPGYGHSPMPAWRSSQRNLVRYVGEFVDALGLDDYVIGGLSLGGGLTLGHLLARTAQGRAAEIRAAMLFGSYGLMDRQVPGVAGRAVQFLSWLSLHAGLIDLAMRLGSRRRFLEASLDNLIRNPQQRTPALLDEIVAASEQSSGLRSFGQFQRSDVAWNRMRTNYTDRLSAITVPVLIVHGDRDPGVPVARARLAAELLPQSELLVVPGAAHWVQRDRPDLVEPVVTEFLRRVQG